MTNKQLNTLCQKWQKILRLQDWDVTASFCSAKDMTTEGRVAETRINFNNKTASVMILASKERPMLPGKNKIWGTLSTLIHELLHLHIEPFVVKCPEQDIDRTQVEQGIECITSGFMTTIGEDSCE